VRGAFLLRQAEAVLLPARDRSTRSSESAFRPSDISALPRTEFLSVPTDAPRPKPPSLRERSAKLLMPGKAGIRVICHLRCVWQEQIEALSGFTASAIPGGQHHGQRHLRRYQEIPRTACKPCQASDASTRFQSAVTTNANVMPSLARRDRRDTPGWTLSGDRIEVNRTTASLVIPLSPPASQKPTVTQPC
jgi:hypothetical protein